LIIDPPSYSESQRKDIFLSYGRESSVSSWVTKLKSDLEESGFTVFLADSHPTNSNGNWFMEIGFDFFSLFSFFFEKSHELNKIKLKNCGC